MNLGQLSVLIRSEYLVDAVSMKKVQGKPLWFQKYGNGLNPAPGLMKLRDPHFQEKNYWKIKLKSHFLLSNQSTKQWTNRYDFSFDENSPAEMKKRILFLTKRSLVSGVRRLCDPVCVQKLMPELGIPRENMVFISGIGCSSRFPITWTPTECTRFMEGLRHLQPDWKSPVRNYQCGSWLGMVMDSALEETRCSTCFDATSTSIFCFSITEFMASPKARFRPPGTRISDEKHTFRIVDDSAESDDLALSAGASFIARALDVDAKGLQTTLREQRNTKALPLWKSIRIVRSLRWYFQWNQWTFSGEDRILRLQDGQPCSLERSKTKESDSKGLKPEIVDVNENTDPSELLVHDKKVKTRHGAFNKRHEFPGFSCTDGSVSASETSTFWRVCPRTDSKSDWEKRKRRFKEIDSWSPGLGSLIGESFRDKNEFPKIFCKFLKSDRFNTYRFSQYPDVYPGSFSSSRGNPWEPPSLEAPDQDPSPSNYFIFNQNNRCQFIIGHRPIRGFQIGVVVQQFQLFVGKAQGLRTVRSFHNCQHLLSGHVQSEPVQVVRFLFECPREVREMALRINVRSTDGPPTGWGNEGFIKSSMKWRSDQRSRSLESARQITGFTGRSSCAAKIRSQAVRQAPEEPGRQKM